MNILTQGAPGSVIEYELLNLATAQAATSGRQTRYEVTDAFITTLEFDDLLPGTFQLTLQNITELYLYTDLCPGEL